MATQQPTAVPRPHAHPHANPGYGKRLAPEQSPRRADDFAHLPRREAAIAGYIDRLPEGADISVKTLARHLADYGQCAVRTALNGLSCAGHLRRHREAVLTGNGTQRWVWRTYWSRGARDDDWWTAFTTGAAVPSSGPQPVRTPSALARTAAYDVLARLGRIDPRLTLSEPECGVLEEVAAEWFERGAGQAQLVQALTAGLPAQVSAPYAFVRARLLAKLPPEPPCPRRTMECTDCGVPAEPAQLPGGLCRTCRGAPAPAAPGGTLPPERVQHHAARLRTALRTPLDRTSEEKQP
ncbi:hypothetical protein AB0P17_03395 [Streptomyces sp. NPDC088124]|uniref:hypothetical protein n=1 Tax=Streptomyces sp. NPDC088124 TaxID=3154654 RepID=UPI0034483EF4